MKLLYTTQRSCFREKSSSGGLFQALEIMKIYEVERLFFSLRNIMLRRSEFFILQPIFHGLASTTLQALLKLVEILSSR